MIDAATRAKVRRRADNRCEYCRSHQDDQDFFAFHVEHVIPKKHGGGDQIANLSFACADCNLSKGSNLTGLLQGKIVPLFNPRRQQWYRHFRWAGLRLVGITRTGKVTIFVLNMNSDIRLILRESLRLEGRFPPEV